MPRPPKQTVDYFSHDAGASRRGTCSILFNNFGHAGISFWWQLLEMLADTPGHFVDISLPERYEEFASKLRIKPEDLREMLGKAAYLEAIDSDLYNKGFIWSQNFIDRLSDVYKKRELPLPERPVTEKGVSGGDNPVNDAGNTPNKIKLNKIKLNNITANAGAAAPGSNGFSHCFNFQDYRILMETYPNKVSFLVSAFKRLHPDAPQEDIDGCGGRIAAIWKRKSCDTGYILGVIWDTAARSIQGSHLNYIEKIILDKSHMTADQAREYVGGKRTKRQ